MILLQKQKILFIYLILLFIKSSFGLSGWAFLANQNDCQLTCKNGGVCAFNTENSNLHKCICFIGMYRGKQCEIPVSSNEELDNDNETELTNNLKNDIVDNINSISNNGIVNDNTDENLDIDSNNNQQHIENNENDTSYEVEFLLNNKKLNLQSSTAVSQNVLNNNVNENENDIIITTIDPINDEYLNIGAATQQFSEHSEEEEEEKNNQNIFEIELTTATTTINNIKKKNLISNEILKQNLSNENSKQIDDLLENNLIETVITVNPEIVTKNPKKIFILKDDESHILKKKLNLKKFETGHPQKRAEMMQYYTTESTKPLKNFGKINGNERRHTRPLRIRLTTTLATLQNSKNNEEEIFDSSENGWMMTKRRAKSSALALTSKLNFTNILTFLLIYFLEIF